jgi:hypothetical protein
MSGPQKKDLIEGPPEKRPPRWPMLTVTILLAVGVVCTISPHQLRFLQSLERHRKEILLDPRAADLLTGPYIFREMDRELPPDAKIFFCGMIGTNKTLYPYFFARTFLFPHEIEISVDHKADYQVDGFRGIDSFSSEQLLTNGYDLMMKFKTEDGSILTHTLTAKGTLKQ